MENKEGLGDAGRTDKKEPRTIICTARKATESVGKLERENEVGEREKQGINSSETHRSHKNRRS